MESLIPDLQNIIYRYVHNINMYDLLPQLKELIDSHHKGVWNQIKLEFSWEDILLSCRYTKVPEPTDAQKILQSHIRAECVTQSFIDDGIATLFEILRDKREIFDNYGRYLNYDPRISDYEFNQLRNLIYVLKK